jgi:hypothetical protein
MLFGGASLAGAFCPSMSWLIVARFFMGLGLGAEIVVGYGTISEFIPARHRGRFAALLNLIINSSLFLATVISVKRSAGAGACAHQCRTVASDGHAGNYGDRDQAAFSRGTRRASGVKTIRPQATAAGNVVDMPVGSYFPCTSLMASFALRKESMPAGTPQYTAT